MEITPFVIFAGAVVIGRVLGSWLQLRFLSMVLATRSPLVEELGRERPMLFRQRALTRFLHEREYRRLGDPRITRYGDILHVYRWTYLVATVIILIVLIAASNH